jgi:hypothetical protein
MNNFLKLGSYDIASATRRVWAGERDWHTLVEDIDTDSALFILRVLETIAAPEEEAPAQPAPGAILASLSTLVLDALQQGDQPTFAQALVALAPTEQRGSWLRFRLCKGRPRMVKWREASNGARLETS